MARLELGYGVIVIGIASGPCGGAGSVLLTANGGVWSENNMNLDGVSHMLLSKP